MEGHRGMESTGALRGIGNMEGHREHGGGTEGHEKVKRGHGGAQRATKGVQRGI